MEQKLVEDSTYRRRESLRLSGFDYSTHRIYFVTIVVSKRRSIFFDKRIAEEVIDCLLQVRQNFHFNLYCYCLMPDHFHALIGIGESNKKLGQICGAFKSLSTRSYWKWYEGKLWQRQYFDHIIRSEKDFYETLEYIKLNPVRKKLVETSREWPYTGSIDQL